MTNLVLIPLRKAALFLPLVPLGKLGELVEDERRPETPAQMTDWDGEPPSE